MLLQTLSLCFSSALPLGFAVGAVDYVMPRHVSFGIKSIADSFRHRSAGPLGASVSRITLA